MGRIFLIFTVMHLHASREIPLFLWGRTARSQRGRDDDNDEKKNIRATLLEKK